MDYLEAAVSVSKSEVCSLYTDSAIKTKELYLLFKKILHP